MGMMVGTVSSGTTTISIKNADGTSAGTIKITKQGRKKRKRLRYDFKEVSARILKAKTSGNARAAVTMARSKAAMLRKKQKSSEYDDSELQSAIIHAEKMVRIAKKRLKHLQEEEKAEKNIRNGQAAFSEEEVQSFDGQEDTDDKESSDISEEIGEEIAKLSKEELEALMQKMKELMEESSEFMEEAGGLEELADELMGSMEDIEPTDLELRKKKHRADELREIMEADMKYLKAMFHRLEKEKQGVSSGVSLELGGAEIPVTAKETPVMTEGGSIDASV